MRSSHSLLLGLREDDHPQYYDESRLAAYLGANPPVPAAHTHTESEITDLGSYLPLGGGTLSGDLSLGNNVLRGVDALWGDQFFSIGADDEVSRMFINSNTGDIIFYRADGATKAFEYDESVLELRFGTGMDLAVDRIKPTGLGDLVFRKGDDVTFMYFDESADDLKLSSLTGGLNGQGTHITNLGTMTSEAVTDGNRINLLGGVGCYIETKRVGTVDSVRIAANDYVLLDHGDGSQVVRLDSAGLRHQGTNGPSEYFLAGGIAPSGSYRSFRSTTAFTAFSQEITTNSGDITIPNHWLSWIVVAQMEIQVAGGEGPYQVRSRIGVNGTYSNWNQSGQVAGGNLPEMASSTTFHISAGDAASHTRTPDIVFRAYLDGSGTVPTTKYVTGSVFALRTS